MLKESEFNFVTGIIAVFSAICLFYFTPIISSNASRLDSVQENQMEIYKRMQDSWVADFEKRCEKARMILAISNGGGKAKARTSLVRDAQYEHIWNECFVETDSSMHFLNESRLNSLIGD